MAKRPTRVEKRYVPQQESYRNLPGLRPAAEPVVAAETPAPSGEGDKLRQWGEALASGNKALKDFFTMEKSFEETTAAENRVRAQMGLPPVGSPGFLDYGTELGYQQGLAIRDAEDISVEVERRFNDRKHEIHPDKLKSADAVREFSDGILAELLQEKGVALDQVSRPYLEVMGPEIAKMKLESRVKALSIYDAQQKLATVDAFNSKVRSVVDNDIIPFVSGIMASPELSMDANNTLVVRNKIAELSKLATTAHRIDRNTANALIVENITTTLQNQMAVGLGEGTNYESVRTTEEVALALMKAVDSPDASGVRLMTTSADPETIKAIGNLRQTVVRFSNEADQMRAKSQKDQAEKKIGQLATKLFTNEINIDQANEIIRADIKSGALGDTSALMVINQLHEMNVSGALAPVTREDSLKYIGMALSGSLSETQVLHLSLTERLPESLTKDMLQGVSAYKAGVSWSHTLRNQRQSAASFGWAQEQHQRTRTSQSNQVIVNTALQGLSGEELEYIKENLSRLMADPTLPLDPDEVTMMVNEGTALYRKINRDYAVLKAAIPMIDTVNPYEKEQREIGAAQLEATRIQKLFGPDSSQFHSATAKSLELEERLKFMIKPRTGTPTKGGGGAQTWQSR
jgi:hypothetical protein